MLIMLIKIVYWCLEIAVIIVALGHVPKSYDAYRVLVYTLFKFVDVVIGLLLPFQIERPLVVDEFKMWDKIENFPHIIIIWWKFSIKIKCKKDGKMFVKKSKMFTII